jgi:hypothetical protein
MHKPFFKFNGLSDHEEKYIEEIKSIVPMAVLEQLQKARARVTELEEGLSSDADDVDGDDKEKKEEAKEEYSDKDDGENEGDPDTEDVEVGRLSKDDLMSNDGIFDDLSRPEGDGDSTVKEKKAVGLEEGIGHPSDDIKAEALVASTETALPTFTAEDFEPVLAEAVVAEANPAPSFRKRIVSRTLLMRVTKKEKEMKDNANEEQDMKKANVKVIRWTAAKKKSEKEEMEEKTNEKEKATNQETNEGKEVKKRETIKKGGTEKKEGRLTVDIPDEEEGRVTPSKARQEDGWGVTLNALRPDAKPSEWLSSTVRSPYLFTDLFVGHQNCDRRHGHCLQPQGGSVHR